MQVVHPGPECKLVTIEWLVAGGSHLCNRPGTWQYRHDVTPMFGTRPLGYCIAAAHSPTRSLAVRDTCHAAVHLLRPCSPLDHGYLPKVATLKVTFWWAGFLLIPVPGRYHLIRNTWLLALAGDPACAEVFADGQHICKWSAQSFNPALQTSEHVTEPGFAKVGNCHSRTHEHPVCYTCCSSITLLQAGQICTMSESPRLRSDLRSPASLN